MSQRRAKALPKLAVRFRRDPYLVSYWIDSGLIVHNYSSGVRVAVSPAAIEVLEFFNRWKSFGALAASLTHYSPSALARLLTGLVKFTLLRQHGDARGSRHTDLESWASWNPAAGFFHFATKDVQYTHDPLKSERRLRRQALTSPVPVPSKRYRGRPTVTLPFTSQDDRFSRVLLSRRTWRDFDARPVALDSLAIALRLTWGVQRWGRVPGQGKVALKTSPSGGARHPGEVYVLARNVKDLARGLYHYSADRHQLVKLRSGASSEDIGAYLPGQPWYCGAAVLVIMTAVFRREQWRYPFARAYRAVLLDAGHLCQTFCLVATWLGLAPFCSMALADSRIEHDLGIDGVTEGVLYAAGLGVRPAHGWRPGIPPHSLAFL